MKMLEKLPRADSGDMPGYYGILNAAGDFWSHSVHKSEAEARDYIRRFWGKDTATAEKCLRTHKVIPVRVMIEPLRARATQEREA